MYMFQANGKANANTHTQKTALAVDKLFGKNLDTAFVQLSATIGAESPEVELMRLLDFIEDFYPEFNRYVTRALRMKVAND